MTKRPMVSASIDTPSVDRGRAASAFGSRRGARVQRNPMRLGALSGEDLVGLNAFAAVVEARSFTGAAAKLERSQSAVSRTVRDFEDRHRVVLLARTTRSVALTDAGEALLESVGPALDVIRDEIAELERWREGISGRLRLVMPRSAALSVLWPELSMFIADNPEIEVELAADDRPIDIVAERYDAGIRLGADVERDMIAVPVGGELRPKVVCSPSYLGDRAAPGTPHELVGHRCIHVRSSPGGPILPWHFEEHGQQLDVPVGEGPVVNDWQLAEAAALAGLGIAQLLDDQVADHVRAGRLIDMLDAWRSPMPGYHLFYSDRRSVRPALRRLIDALRAGSRRRTPIDQID